MSFATSEKEEKYFKEQELKQRLQHAAEQQTRTAAEENNGSKTCTGCIARSVASR